MSIEIKEYRVFIASPAGLEEERRVFRDTLAEYNQMDAQKRGVCFWPVGWEDTPGGIGRPQSIINHEIRSCDYLVMVLWDRWGSRPNKPGERGWSSGTEEEYHIAYECLDSTLMPMKDLVVFFRAVDARRLSDPGSQLARVLDFKRKLDEERNLLYHTYDEVKVFGDLLRRHLARWVRYHESGNTTRIQKPEMPPGLVLGGSETSAVGMQVPAQRAMSQTLKEAWRLAGEGRFTDAEVKFAESAVSDVHGRSLAEYALFLQRLGRVAQANEVHNTVMKRHERLERSEEGARCRGDIESVCIRQGDNRSGPKQGEQTPDQEGQIGPYKLLRVLGEGGFGVVHLAEQRWPVKRRVAVKVIKPGMDTKQVVARFEAERQALAILNHPNIARVFDAGMTPTGRPYFVMEYVKGVPITEYCDLERLCIDDRLRLFIPVCEAIQHAHQKGIIHRDIKPSNILVTPGQDKPVPVVIDFGVAKALSQRLTERTLFTEQGQLIGTPEYMSPEQAEMTNLDIDTRSDIYSLGVLLYELLTGVRPFEHTGLREAAVAEIQRIIREEEPPRPSTKLSGLGEKGTTHAWRRQTEIRTLARRLHEELEWIPLMAMRKERERRYGTASELAQDVKNYLEGKPLRAGPESAWYRSRKYVHRHRYASTVLCLLGVILIGNAFISVYFYGGYYRARQDAKAKDKITKEHQESVNRALFQVFLGLWEGRAGSAAELVPGLIPRSREQEAASFLLDPRPLEAKQAEFQSRWGQRDPALWYFVLWMYYTKNGPADLARDAWKCLTDGRHDASVGDDWLVGFAEARSAAPDRLRPRDLHPVDF